MTRKPRKAILPVAGLGTHCLPATKAPVKPMLPVASKPLIQYAMEEARAAGVEQFCPVNGRSKIALVKHFDVAYALESPLYDRDKQAPLTPLRNAQGKPNHLTG